MIHNQECIIADWVEAEGAKKDSDPHKLGKKFYNSLPLTYFFFVKFYIWQVLQYNKEYVAMWVSS